MVLLNTPKIHIMSYKFSLVSLILCFVIASNQPSKAQKSVRKKANIGTKLLTDTIGKPKNFDKKISIDLSKQKLVPKLEIISVTNYKKSNKSKKKKSKSQEAILKIEDGELAIHYPVKPLKSQQSYKTDLSVKFNDKKLDIPPEMIHQELGVIHWFGLAETNTQLSGKLEVAVNYQILEAKSVPYWTDCTNIPTTMKVKEKIPHWIGFGLGAAAIGAGISLRMESQDIYENQYLIANSRDEAAPIYNKANEKHRQFVGLTIAGGGLILADAILFVIRQKRYEKHVDLYNSSCLQEKVSFHPTIDFSGSEAVRPYVGLQMQFTF